MAGSAATDYHPGARRQLAWSAAQLGVVSSAHAGDHVREHATAMGPLSQTSPPVPHHTGADEGWRDVRPDMSR
eukprot:1060599-Pleurochrysis_carterae.AAC.3